jgi:hypothetical protein
MRPRGPGMDFSHGLDPERTLGQRCINLVSVLYEIQEFFTACVN